MIFIENKKKSHKTLIKLYPEAEIIDVTSRGVEPFVRLSPFYPHGNIPVPFSEGIFAFSVEGIWQGLKVFEFEDVDIAKFEIRNMKGIKRTVRSLGKPIGHRKGTNGVELLNYLAARMQIYLPTYAWVLQNKTVKEIEFLIEIALRKDLVLLDFETNGDFENITKPLSHAALIKRFIDKKHPELKEKRFSLSKLNQSKGKLVKKEISVAKNPSNENQETLNFKN
jgi:hypothetical protein